MRGKRTFMSIQNVLDSTSNSKHTGRTLREHLDGTANILRHWCCSEDVILAGLYHSVYGTVSYKTITTSNRDLIRETIGYHAEQLVFEFCKTKYPRMQNFITHKNKELILIECANLMEQKSRAFDILDSACDHVPTYIADDIRFYIMDHH